MTDLSAPKTGFSDRDGHFKILVSSDAMEARLLIEPPTGQGRWPAKSDVLDALRTENITSGIDLHAINEVIMSHLTQPVVIAKGKTPLAGNDAEIKLVAVELPGIHENESGRVDYHEIQTVQCVTQGQVIAEKHPATPGEAGYNVHGKEIPAVPGKDKPIHLGKNVAWAENNLQIIATNGGEPSMANCQISVLPIHEVKGDVNLHTGNINFPGNLMIHGNVESGFKVEAEGNITITGIVDAADVRAGGNLTIQGGVSGMDKSKISCEGDLAAKYIEHATVNCGGNITVKEFIMHSHASTDHKITAEGGKGLIAGGLIHAGQEIAANTVGSRAGTVTEIEVGLVSKFKAEGTHGHAKEHLDYNPETPSPEHAGGQEFAEDGAKGKDKGRLKVRDIIYPGVKVTMGSTTMSIQDEIHYSTLVYHDGEILIKPYS